jgi:hypothetical protein
MSNPQPPPEPQTLGDIEVPERIRLRLKLLLRDLHIERDEALVIASPGAHDIEIRYRRPNADELHLGAEWAPPLSLGSSICEVAGQWGISSKNRDAFTKLAKEGVGELPPAGQACQLGMRFPSQSNPCSSRPNATSAVLR